MPVFYQVNQSYAIYTQLWKRHNSNGLFLSFIPHTFWKQKKAERPPVSLQHVFLMLIIINRHTHKKGWDDNVDKTQQNTHPKNTCRKFNQKQHTTQEKTQNGATIVTRGEVLEL